MCVCVCVCVCVCSVRECGAERSLKLLSLEQSSASKLPSLSHIDIHRLHDLLIVKSPRALSTDSLPSVCQARHTHTHTHLQMFNEALSQNYIMYQIPYVLFTS